LSSFSLPPYDRNPLPTLPLTFLRNFRKITRSRKENDTCCSLVSPYATRRRRAMAETTDRGKFHVRRFSAHRCAMLFSSSSELVQCHHDETRPIVENPPCLSFFRSVDRSCSYVRLGLTEVHNFSLVSFFPLISWLPVPRKMKKRYKIIT
jgi:hypothetical protein